MGKTAGTVAIIVGTIVVGFSPERWDKVILVLPRGHGIHINDLIGVALVAFGIALLWRSPGREDVYRDAVYNATPRSVQSGLGKGGPGQSRGRRWSERAVGGAQRNRCASGESAPGLPSPPGVMRQSIIGCSAAPTKRMVWGRAGYLYLQPGRGTRCGTEDMTRTEVS